MTENQEEQREPSRGQDESQQEERKDDFTEKLSDYTKEQSDKANIYIQYRIYNNHGVMTGDGSQIESIRFNEPDMPAHRHWKGSVFEEEDGLAKWLTEHYASYAMALMTAAAVFDSLPYAWIIRAAERLYESFSSQGEENKIYAQIEILHQFEAEIYKGELNTYTGTTPIDIVILNDPEHRKRILKCIWQQYPQLQDKMISWLRSFIEQRPVTMSRRALETLGFFACEDYYYFLNHIVPWIAREESSSTDMMVGQILIILNQRDDYKKNVYNLLHVWSVEGRLHHMLAALFVCVQSGDKNDILECIVKNYICRTIKEIRRGTVLTYRTGLYDFMGAGIRSFTFYRILIETLEDEVNRQSSKQEKQDVYELFLWLFGIDISMSRPHNGEEAVFIKLCMVGHAIADRLCALWRVIWQCGSYRQAAYKLLAEYDAKTKGAEIRYSMEKFVNKVFGNVCSGEMRQDICSKIHRRVKNA